jgi:hypothetical protein
MIDRHSLPKEPTEQLATLLSDLMKQDKTTRLANFGLWRDAGFILAELKERHLTGKLGSGSWASYCKKLRVTKADADLYIAASQADDPAAFLDRLYLLEEQREARRKSGKDKEEKAIIVKQPGVIFGYITGLPEAGRREVFALCWRMFGRELRKVGDELGWDDDRGDVARPHGTA